MERADLNKAWLRIEEPEAVQVLIDHHELRFLKPFVLKEHSLSQAAKELGMTPSAMLYRIKKLLRLGLIELARVEPRKGRAVKYYRATSERFFVPFEATSAESLERLLYEMDEEGLHDFVKHRVRASADLPSWGLGVCRTANGLMSVSFLPAPDHHPDRIVEMVLETDFPAIWASFSRLYLSYEGAKALQHDLVKLFELYKEHGQGSGQAYLLRLGLTPVTPD
jgi:DNA-binding transcriptional ArsR family regulator